MTLLTACDSCFTKDNITRSHQNLPLRRIQLHLYEQVCMYNGSTDAHQLILG